MTISKDLFLAILSMDAYNRGYGEGISGLSSVTGTAIGNATIFQDANDQAGIARSTGFYAIAYTTTADIGNPANGGVIPAGTTVISYRGTDVAPYPIGNGRWLDASTWNDVLNWPLAAGYYDGSEVPLAFKFERSVQGNATGPLLLTGHSLGGGLAGFVSGVTGVKADLFDPIGFVGALSALQTAVTTGTPIVNMETGQLTFLPVDQNALALYFNGHAPEAPIAFGVDQLAGMYLTGDIADKVRSRSDNAYLAALDFPQGSGLSGPSLHSAALLVMGLYARDHGLLDGPNSSWKYAADRIFSLTSSDEIGSALGLKKDDATSFAPPGAQMQMEIAYTALDSNAPFGTMAIRSLFADADKVSAFVSAGTSSSLMAGAPTKDALVKILVQYAGDQAAYAGSIGGLDYLANAAAPEGALADATGAFGKSTAELLIANLDPTRWGRTFGAKGLGSILGEKELLDLLLLKERRASDSIPTSAPDPLRNDPIDPILHDAKTSSVMSGAQATEILASITSGTTINASAGSALPAALANGRAGGAIIVGDDSGDRVTGSPGSDLIFLGRGKNVVNITAGTDVIFGGSGGTTIEMDSSLQGGPGATGGTTYYISAATGDTARFGESVKASFRLAASQGSPFSGDNSGKKWVAYSASINGHWYDLWLDPVSDESIFLPESATSNTGGATDEFDDADAPNIDVHQDEHFVRATLDGNWALDKAVQASLIDAGSPDEGYGNKLDVTDFSRKNPLKVETTNGTLVSFGGAYIKNNELVGSGITFKNFQIYYGTDKGDLIVGRTDFKNVYLGNGDNYVKNLSGGVIGGQTGARANWVDLHLGSGNSTVAGKLAPGSEIWISGSSHADKIEISPDTEIHGLGANDQLFVDGELLTGGVRFGNNPSDPWAYSYDHKVKYGINQSGQLVIARNTTTLDHVLARIGGSALGDQSTFIDNFQNGVTAGINLLQVNFQVYQFMHIPESVDGSDSHTFSAWREIARAWFGASCRNFDPLVLDLGGNGVDVTSINSLSGRFDVNADGFATPSSWVPSSQGILVRLGLDGLVTSSAQFFGGATGDAFAELAAYDVNADGVVDDSDLSDPAAAVLAPLRIWVDRNEDHRASAEELLTLDQAGVRSIDVAGAAAPAGATIGDANVVATGSFTRTDGSSGAMADLLFQSDNYDSTYLGDRTLTANAAAGPDLFGHGTLPDLAIALSVDERAQNAGVSGAQTRLEQIVASSLAGISTAPDFGQWRNELTPLFAAWAQALPDPDPTGAPRWFADLRDGEGNSISTAEEFKSHALTTTADGVSTADALRMHWRNVEPVIEGPDGATATESVLERYWAFDSGRAIVDTAGQTIETPTLEQALAMPLGAGQSWQTGQDRPAWYTIVTTASDGSQTVVDDVEYVSQTFHAGDADPVTGQTVEADKTVGYWVFHSGRQVLATDGSVIARPTLEQALGATLSAGQTWNVYTADELTFLERYLGAPLAVGLRPANWSQYDVSLRSFGLTVQGDMNALIARLVVQGPLGQTILSSIAYDAATDSFSGKTDRGMEPVYEAVFTQAAEKAATNPAAALKDLAAWNGLIQIVLQKFETPNGQILKTPDYLFGNIIAAYEASGLGAYVPFLDAAEAMGVMRDRVVVHSAGNDTVLPPHEFNLVYVGGGSATYQVHTPVMGAAKTDEYVVGGTFGHSTIDDSADEFASNASSLRFATLKASELSFARDGADLVITENDNGQTLRVVDQFTNPNYQDLIFVHGNTSAKSGVDTITFADGETWSLSDISLAVADFHTHDQTIAGLTGNDVLIAGPGDRLVLTPGAETVVYQRGAGSISIESGVNPFAMSQYYTLLFGPGIAADDLEFDRVGLSKDLTVRIKGTEDVITIKGQFDYWSNVPFTRDAYYQRIDTFQFADGASINADELMSSMLEAEIAGGNEIIYGFPTDDVIDPGPGGGRILQGQTGADTYVFGRGYGFDRIYSNPVNGSSTDTVAFGDDIALSDLTFRRLYGTDDLEISITGADDRLRLCGQFSDQRVATFVLADGTTLTADEVSRLAVAQSIAAGETYVVAGKDHVAEILDPGPGAGRVLVGGGNSETYVFGRGYGHETIEQNGGEVSQILFGPGIAIDDLEFFLRGQAIEIHIKGTADTLTVCANIGGDYNVPPFSTLAFADGATIDFATFDQEYLQPLRGNPEDAISADTQGVFHYSRGDGLRQMNGANSVLVLDNIDAADVSVDWAPRNSSGGVLIRIAGVDGSAYGEISATGLAQLAFADGETWSAAQIAQEIIAHEEAQGFALIRGGEGADTIEAGAGENILAGGAGKDTYVWRSGDRRSVIQDVGENSIVLHDVAPADVVVQRDALNPAQINVLTESLHGYGFAIQGQLTSGAVARIEFDDGTVWTEQDLVHKLFGDFGSAPTIQGLAGENVVLQSGAQVVSFGGDNVVNWGSASGPFASSEGITTYLFGVGSGDNIVADKSTMNNRLAAVRLVGLNPADVTFSWQAASTEQFAKADWVLPTPDLLNGGNRSLAITINATGETLTIARQNVGLDRNDFAYGGGLGVSNVQFADGSIWDAAEIYAHANLWVGAPENDTISGSAGAETFHAGKGDDAIYGGGGSDVYLWAAGDGNDTITTSLNAPDDNNVLKLSGVAAGDVDMKLAYTDSIVRVRTTGEEIRLVRELDGGGIQAIEFDDGTVWNRDFILANSFIYGDPAQPTGYDTVWHGVVNYKLGAGDYGPVIVARNQLTRVVWGPGDGDQQFSAYRANLALSFDGLSASDLRFERTGTNHADLSVVNLATGKALSFSNFFWSDDAAASSATFGDGVTWSLDEIAAHSAVYGTPGQSTGYDTQGFRSMVYDLGAGDYAPVTAFGDAALTIRWSARSGAQTFNLIASSGTVLLDGLNPLDVQFGRTGQNAADLILVNTATGKSLLLPNQFNGQGAVAFVFADGTTWSRQDIIDHAAIHGTPGQATGYDTHDRGERIVYDLGAGDYGPTSISWEAATIRWNGGDGDQTFSMSGYVDVRLESDLSAADLRFERTGRNFVDLSVVNVATGKRLTIQNEFSGHDAGINSIAFGDGAVLDFSEIAQRAVPHFGAGFQFADISNSSPSTYYFGAGDAALYENNYWANIPRTYVYERGNGNVYLRSEDLNAGESLILKDIASTDVTFARTWQTIYPGDGTGTSDVWTGANVTITDKVTGKTIVLDGELYRDAMNGIGSIVFTDRTVAKEDLMLLLADAVPEPATFLLADAGASVDMGNPFGSNYYFGGGQAVDIVADANDHVVTASDYINNFVYARSDGNLTIDNPRGSQSLRFTDLASADVQISTPQTSSSSAPAAASTI